MTGSFDYLDLVSGPHVTLDDYAEVGPGSQRLRETAWKRLVVHPNSKPPARYARLGNLKDYRPNLPTLADERMIHVDSLGREVFAKLTVGKHPPDLLLPPVRILDGVGVKRFIRSPVRLAIRLVVSGKIDTSGGNSTDNR
jgi:hypothetical protein